MFNILEIKDSEQIQAFLGTNSLLGSEFLLSPEWLAVIDNGQYPWPFAVLDKSDRIRALFSLVPYELAPGFTYAYSPRGPVVSSGVDAEEYQSILEKIAAFLKKKGFIFWRLEGSRELPAGFSHIPSRPIQPEHTLALDLGVPEEDLLSAMHQKTRYNIRLAEKKGVVIETGSSEDDFADFWRLITITKDRDSFSIHDREHYHRLFSADPNFICLLLARYEGRTIAAGIFCFYGYRVSYLHGASSDEDRNVMAPFLLQWQAIRLAKERGYRLYDFYGIDEKRWPGVTRFKRGFGGFEFDYPGTAEYALRPVYYRLFRLLKSVRKILWWKR